MAIKTRTNGDRLNEAIVNKVEKILNSADCIQSVHIEIDGAIGEMPMIKYNICEKIIPNEDLERDNDDGSVAVIKL